ncbi:hypothetical protein [Nocardiopsis sp. NPDC006938]|uniref:hypothetical protein n=1 Tax=Nocardiopsis sp. NPDC006938 TaxID=3364337 RepID=UPI0036C1A932
MSQNEKNQWRSAASSRATLKPTPDAAPKKTGRVLRDGEKKIRTTFDLDPPDYLRLRSVVTKVATTASRPTLHASDMWRAIIAEVDEDEELVERLAERLREMD